MPSNIGVIGLGAAGKMHLTKVWSHPFEVTHAYDSDPGRRGIIPDCTAVSSLDDMWSDEIKIDLVVVATPPGSHYDVASAALKAGKHVVVEKPTTLCLRDTSRLIKMAQSTNRLLITHFNRRWESAFGEVLRVIRGRKLGRIHHFEGRVSDGYDGSGRFPGRRKWKLNSEDGGILVDWAPHLLDQLFEAFPNLAPSRVACHTLRPNKLAQRGIEEQFILTVFYPEMTAILGASWNAMLNAPRWYVAGTSGAFRIDEMPDIDRVAAIRYRSGADIVFEDDLARSSEEVGPPVMFSTHVEMCMKSKRRAEREYKRMKWVSHAIDLAKRSIDAKSPQRWRLSM